MKREVTLYIGAVVLIVVVFLFSFFQPELTGFAVFQQQDQSGFNEGVYENVFYDANLSAIILSVNQTSGDYTSKIFDAGDDSVWNNLTWVGQGSINFQIRACSSSDCSNSTFSSVDLTNINLTSQYFQYKVSFNEDPNLTISLESVSIDYSVLISVPPFFIFSFFQNLLSFFLRIFPYFSQVSDCFRLNFSINSFIFIEIEIFFS